MTTNKERVRQFRAAFDALPISAFDAVGDESTDTVLRSIFGPETTSHPMIHVAEVGGWVSRRTVVTTSPHSDGVFAFQVGVTEHDASDHIGSSRGSRINALSGAMSKIWAAPDRVDLAVKLMRKAGEIEDDGYRINLSRSGALNGEPKPWVLHHVLATLSEEERNHHAMFLASLGLSETVFTRARRLVDAVENITVNWADRDAVEEASAAAVKRYNGVAVSGYQLEKLGIPGALLPVHHTNWESAADALVRSAYAWHKDSLDESFFPRPDPPPRPPKSSKRASAASHFPLAG